MGKTKSKKTTTPKVSEGQVEARPIGQGKDPLSEGATLHNPSNTEAETHYEADNSELNAEEAASKIRGQDANERAEEHNTQLAQGAPDHDTPNQGQSEQDEVAEGRTEEPIDRAEEQAADDTPVETVVPDLSDEEQADVEEEREEALAKDRKTFGK